MEYIFIESMDKEIQVAFSSLVNACDGYEPFYSYEADSRFVQCALISSDCGRVIMHGFVGIMIDSESKTAEVSGMVEPAYRLKGHFREMITMCLKYINRQGDFKLLAPVSESSTIGSLCGEYAFSEYLYKINYSDYSSFPAPACPEPEGAEYFLDENEFLMYLPAYEEPVGILELDRQNTFVNIYGVYVDKPLRGCGIGTCLMTHFLREYFGNNNLPLVLNVSGRNPAALLLYKKCGFTEASRINYHYITCQFSPDSLLR